MLGGSEWNNSSFGLDPINPQSSWGNKFYLKAGLGEAWALQLSDRALWLCLTRLEVLDSTENFGADVPTGAENPTECQTKAASDQPECWSGGGLGWTDKGETEAHMETLLMGGYCRELGQGTANGLWTGRHVTWAYAVRTKSNSNEWTKAFSGVSDLF